MGDGSNPSMRNPMRTASRDADPEETQEWLDALQAVVAAPGSERPAPWTC